MLNVAYKKRLQSLSTPLVADAMEQLGLDGVVDPTIRPVVPFSRMIGSAVTVKFESIEITEAVPLTHYLEALSRGREYFDPVIVLQLPRDRHGYGILGEGAATAARATGYVGALVDGAVRDTHELKEMGFPVFSRLIAMRFIIGKVKTVSFNETVTIGGILVRARDVVFADNDGVLIIPQGRLEEIIERAEAIKAWEHRFHALLAQGKSFEEAEEIAGPMPGAKRS